MKEFNCVDNMAAPKPLSILIAEDEPDIAILYKTVLEKRNHKATITTNGEDCLKAYHEVSQSKRFATDQSSVRPGPMNISENHPFDVVVLDCKMPHINGIEVAKEILAVNPHQRIIFASAYVKETLEESVKCLHKIVELIQKPFTIDKLINTLEDNEIFAELQKLNIDIDMVKAVNPTHEQIMDLLEKVRPYNTQEPFKLF